MDSLLKQLFGKNRIVGLAGEKNIGKSNNIIAIIKDFRETNKDTPIYIYGFEEKASDWLKKLGNIYVISTLEHLIGKKNAIFFLDEFHKLKINDKRHKDILNDFVSMIYHIEQNNYVVLCSPSLREFNSIIGGRIERWALKSIKLNSLINGSQLKKVVQNYQGNFKRLNDIIIPHNKLLIINDDVEKVMTLKYIKEVDTKIGIKDIFEKSLLKSPRKSQKKKSEIKTKKVDYIQ